MSDEQTDFFFQKRKWDKKKRRCQIENPSLFFLSFNLRGPLVLSRSVCSQSFSIMSEWMNAFCTFNISTRSGCFAQRDREGIHSLFSSLNSNRTQGLSGRCSFLISCKRGVESIYRFLHVLLSACLFTLLFAASDSDSSSWFSASVPSFHPSSSHLLTLLLSHQRKLFEIRGRHLNWCAWIILSIQDLNCIITWDVYRLTWSVTKETNHKVILQSGLRNSHPSRHWFIQHLTW